MSYDTSVLAAEHILALSAQISRALGEAREEIDALNVFPVPDSDTGTNLALTFDEAHDVLTHFYRDSPGATVSEAAAVYRRALLMAARGNSGVIMSQLCGAMLRKLDEPPGESLPSAFASAMVAATDAAYAAVGDPKEGTILSVARAASLAATEAAAQERARIWMVVRAAAAAAREALEATPDQMELLRAAGVVDAGGRGLVVLLEAIETILTGRVPVPRSVRRPVPARVELPTGDLVDGGPAYEVMYLLDAEDAAIPALRAALMPLGDSLVVVGGEGLWNVHVHVDDVGAAIEAGLEAGRPHRIRVTHFAEQIAGRQPQPRAGRAVVEVAFGEGLAATFREAGATVVMAGPEQRPSSRELYEAMLATGAAEVIVVPNARDIADAADAAARRAGEVDDVRVAVVPSYSQVQGLAALAVHDPGRNFDTDLIEMTAAGSHARSGAVTIAETQAMTMAGPCEVGDVLGVVEGDFAIVGSDLFVVAQEVLDKMLGGGGELVTIVAGEGGAALSDRIVTHVTDTYAHVDVVAYDGGQQRYPLLIGVE